MTNIAKWWQRAFAEFPEDVAMEDLTDRQKVRFMAAEISDLRAALDAPATHPDLRVLAEVADLYDRRRDADGKLFGDAHTVTHQTTLGECRAIRALLAAWSSHG